MKRAWLGKARRVTRTSTTCFRRWIRELDCGTTRMRSGAARHLSPPSGADVAAVRWQKPSSAYTSLEMRRRRPNKTIPHLQREVQKSGIDDPLAVNWGI